MCKHKVYDVKYCFLKQENQFLNFQKRNLKKLKKTENACARAHKNYHKQHEWYRYFDDIQYRDYCQMYAPTAIKAAGSTPKEAGGIK